MLSPGDPFPAVTVRTTANPTFALDSTGGRYVVITFVAGTSFEGCTEYLRSLYASGSLFDDAKTCCFVVSSDPADEAQGRLADRAPGIRVIWDHTHALARKIGNFSEAEDGGSIELKLVSFVLDPCQRVIETIPVQDLRTHFHAVQKIVEALPDPVADQDSFAPVLVIPKMLEPELCRDFIAYADEHGLEDSGYMTTDRATGKTIGVIDHRHKRRFDCLIEDERLRLALQARVLRRLAPQIEKAFQFKLSRMERYLVACYESEGGGWFRPHKDNTTMGTAHRRFAISIALNDDYEGGGVRFPEFGRRIYNAPVGGAVVFSCSLLHEAVPVTSGRRLCLLPFVYDEAAAQVRLNNAAHFADKQLAQDVVASVLNTPGYFSKQSAA